MIENNIEEKIAEYIEKNITRIIKSGVDIGKEFSIRYLAQGEYNLNYKLIGNKEYVFRINTESQIEVDNQIKYEFDAIKYLESSEVTPKVYYLDESKEFLGCGILIMEFLPGRHLNYNMDIKIAGNLIGKVHSIPVERADNLILENEIFSDRIREGKRLLENVWETRYLDAQIKDVFEKFISWAENNEKNQKYFIENPYLVINNTELNSGNFLINEGKKSYIIDWEKPVISDPSQDISQFLAITTTLWKTEYILNEEDEEQFYNSYISVIGRDNDIKERVRLYQPYLYLRAFSWCAHAYVKYNDKSHSLMNMDTYDKIKQFLEYDFITSVLKPYGIV